MSAEYQDFWIGQHPCRVVEEHGQEWAVCRCGAQFSLDDGLDPSDYEQVSEGEEGFHDGPGEEFSL